MFSPLYIVFDNTHPRCRSLPPARVFLFRPTNDVHFSLHYNAIEPVVMYKFAGFGPFIGMET
jgi:hypothetical protein